MNGLGTRVARRLNRVMQRRGKVLDDRYHEHILRTPSEVSARATTSCRTRTNITGTSGPIRMRPWSR